MAKPIIWLWSFPEFSSSGTTVSNMVTLQQKKNSLTSYLPVCSLVTDHYLLCSPQIRSIQELLLPSSFISRFLHHIVKNDPYYCRQNCLSAINTTITSSPDVLHWLRAVSDVYRDINKEHAAAARQRFWLYLIYKYSPALGSLVSIPSSPISVSSPPFSPHSCSLYDSMTFGHNLSGNLPLLPYFPYIKSEGGVSLRRRPLSDPPRIGSFIHELFPCSGVVPSFQRPCPLPPLMKKACKLRRAGCRCAQWSILIAQESIGIWVRLVPLKGWPEDLALSVLSVTEISTQACIRLMWQSPYCLHANAHAV